METRPHCSVFTPRLWADPLWIGLLTIAVVLVHGYHPWAEDGGLYVSGIEYKLDPSLFPHERAFVTEHLAYSIFAPAIAAAVRLSHLSLQTVLFATYALTSALTLFAALQLLRRCVVSTAAQWTGVALLATWWTLPVAATSLLLMDPYVTARSVSTPLSLLAVAAALEPWGTDRKTVPPALLCASALVTAALFHPLMAGYALGMVIAIRLALRLAIARRPVWISVALCALVLLGSAGLQAASAPDAPALVAAVHSRYYWFLAQWHWYEWIGLLAPLLVLYSLRRWGSRWMTHTGRALSAAAIAFAALATLVALLFAQERLRAHTVARMQPLRAFVFVYALLALLGGASLWHVASAWLRTAVSPPARALARLLAPAVIGSMALLMFLVQRATFPSSIHLELPGRQNPNQWVEAFRWARDHTPQGAVFALDARYINANGEDAQTFRAISQRSAVPDFFKDGGEAAIAPRLAPEWQRGADATAILSGLSDAQRDARLAPFGVHWAVLQTSAATRHPCPYINPVVKICNLRP